ncbi:MAG: hypothetical protein HY908_34970 [Myxococcales bacterium]|nr:hypothetical protein [Myxococcales bacterium]
MDLASLNERELEDLYRSAPLGPTPRGRFRGRMLGFVAPGGPGPAMRLLDRALFEWTPYGIDFDRSLWWFVAPALRVGRFRASVGPSRWREAEVVRLEYDVSRLPGPLRRILYDEVKPLDEGTALGLGGVNAERGRGDHFFFALERLGS